MLYRATRRIQVDNREFEPGEGYSPAAGREHLADELLKLGAIEPADSAAAPAAPASEKPASEQTGGASGAPVTSPAAAKPPRAARKPKQAAASA